MDVKQLHQANLKDVQRALAYLALMEDPHHTPVVRHALESIQKRAEMALERDSHACA